MALPMLRGCLRVQSTFGFTRLSVNELTLLNRSGKGRVPLSSPAAVTGTVRLFSSDWGGQKPKQKVVVFGLPNPFIWFRTRIYYFLIRAYFDKEFSIEEFTEGAKQVCRQRPDTDGTWSVNDIKFEPWCVQLHPLFTVDERKNISVILLQTRTVKCCLTGKIHNLANSNLTSG